MPWPSRSATATSAEAAYGPRPGPLERARNAEGGQEPGRQHLDPGLRTDDCILAARAARANPDFGGDPSSFWMTRSARLDLLAQRQRARPGQVEALAERDVEVDQRLQLLVALDPLGDHRRAALLRERDQAGRQRLARAVVVDRVDQRAVELDEVGVEPEDVAQAREAGAGVVDRQADAAVAQRGQRP